MNVLVYLVPMALALGLTGLAAFLWSLRSGQYEDMDGAALRVLSDDDVTSQSYRAPCGPPCEDDGPAERAPVEWSADSGRWRPSAKTSPLARTGSFSIHNRTDCADPRGE
jgi:cbb3-type cytochrome oxidase maturation protein